MGIGYGYGYWLTYILRMIRKSRCEIMIFFRNKHMVQYNLNLEEVFFFFFVCEFVKKRKTKTFCLDSATECSNHS